jgi:ketosteroid isomerase-like protein
MPSSPPESALDWPPGTSSPEQVLARYQQAVIDRNADGLAELYAPHAVHEIPFVFPGMPSRFQGVEQVRAAYGAAWAATEARPQAVRITALHRTEDPAVVVVEQVVAGVNASSAEPFELPGVLVLRVEGGLITHVRDYMDALAVARAAGRLPSLVETLSSDT